MNIKEAIKIIKDEKLQGKKEAESRRKVDKVELVL